MHRAKQLRVISKLRRSWSPTLFIGVFALVGVAVLLSTRASTPVNNALEPEAGSLNGGAAALQDANASNGSYVSFQAQATANSVIGGTDTSCVFQKADKPMHLAFCEGFGTDYSGQNAGNRSGSLYNPLWGVSRNNTSVNPGQGQFGDWYSAHLTGCGQTQLVFPTKDVQVCNGRLQEASYDGGTDDPIYGRSAQPTNGLSALTIYPKQPFDFTNRTGTVVFDVSADSAGGHQAWPEFWITDRPVPTPGDLRSQWDAFARNSFGFVLAADCRTGDQKAQTGMTGIDHISYTKNYQSTTVYWQQLNMPNGQCAIKKATGKTGPLNHFELRINANGFEIWGSDPGSSTLILLAQMNLQMPLTKGLIWLEDIHYNGCKYGPVNGPGTIEQCDHDFAWDNVGFDGPPTYRDLSFDVPDANIKKDENTVQLGYKLPNGLSQVLQVNGVYRLKAPDLSLVTFTWTTQSKTVPSFKINDGPWHDTAWPFADDRTFSWRTIDITVPNSEIKDGTNTIQFKHVEDTVISNINMILVNGSPVPTALQ